MWLGDICVWGSATPQWQERKKKENEGKKEKKKKGELPEKGG